MNTKRLIVTQKEHDVLLLRSIFQITQDTPALAVIGVGGYSMADSYARTCLLDNSSDVALVVNADTTVTRAVEDRRRFLHRSLGEIPTKKSYHIVVVVPEILGLLFRHQTVAEQLVNNKISHSQFLHAAYEPTMILQQLLPNEDLIEFLSKRLPAIDVSRLADEPDLGELKKFVQQARRTTRTAA